MYRLTQTECILRLADGAHIPPDPGNRDYAAYLAWIGAGNTAGPYEPPPPRVPDRVSMRQARRALRVAGLLPAIEAAINAMSEPARTDARIEWDYSSEVQRHNGFVSVLAGSLGLDDAELDALFVAAGEIA
jgi:hypothetical protein